MGLKMNRMEEEAEYKLDTTQTFLTNMFWFLSLFVVIGFLIIGIGQLKTLILETNKLLYLIVITFAFVQLLRWVGHPHLHFKRKE